MVEESVIITYEVDFFFSTYTHMLVLIAYSKLWKTVKSLRCDMSSSGLKITT